MAFRPDAITPCTLAAATLYDDLDDAVLVVQDACGIETGDAAGIFFSDIEGWESMDGISRLKTMISYAEFEKTQHAATSHTSAA